MAKRKHQKRRVGSCIALSLVVVAIISVVILSKIFLDGSDHIVSTPDNQKNGLLKQQVTTIETTTTQTTQMSHQETTTTETTMRKASSPQRQRLEEIGNSKKEFETLDEASDFAEKVVNDPKSLAELQRQGYGGYVIRAVRWSDNTVTYTIDWV